MLVKERVGEGTRFSNNEFELDFSTSESELIVHMIDLLSSNQDIYPVIDFENNEFSYPSLLEIGDTSEILGILEKLASEKFSIIKRVIHERIPVCPDHPQYLAAVLRLYCPSCFSSDIKKLHLIEHRSCGYIEESDHRLIPKKCKYCNKTIQDPITEIRKIGRWYHCNKCKSKFDKCEFKLHCIKYDHDFDISQSIIIDIPAYRLRSCGRLSPFYTVALMTKLKTMLESSGLKVNTSFKLKSETEHRGLLYVFNSDKSSAIVDILNSEDEIGDEQVSSTIVKALHLSPNITIFVGIGNISKKAQIMAENHRISVVTEDTFEKISSAVVRIIASAFGVNSHGGESGE